MRDEGWGKEIEFLGEEEFGKRMYEVPGVKQGAKSEEEGRHSPPNAITPLRVSFRLEQGPHTYRPIPSGVT